MTDAPDQTRRHDDPACSEPAAGPEGDGVRALARVLDRTGRKVTALGSHVRRLATDVARLASLTAGSTTTTCTDSPGSARGAAADGASAGVRCWLLAGDPDQAVADLADLVEWLDRVFLRYPDAVLGSCWLWHPHVIEELWWCRQAHADAYHSETGSWLRVGDWHERQRPGVARRVGSVLAKCDLTLHAPGRPQASPQMVAPLAAHVGQIAHYWAAGQGARPEPSPAQYAEAEAYQRSLHRSHR
ncbi:hypothetical protein EV383_4251 [Pseudonocardia sediminis]|uniref:Uncharacterized protein n=1 Tax=Pseudonocardia sediminis TaxID=1397368 RepID=A0A4Q7UYZ6_PSEST|nr:hypothetical protein [Pseudonocardia sediminis]RZT87332.1 hypothetical protein EV383_4251 [Pseudonocardia sediminis]